MTDSLFSEYHNSAEYHHQQLVRDAISAALKKLRKPTAARMAKAVYKVLRAQAKAIGQNPDSEVLIRKPGEERHFSDTSCWVVAWEAGPYDWAISASFAVISATGFLCEPYYGFDLCFYPNEDR